MALKNKTFVVIFLVILASIGLVVGIFTISNNYLSRQHPKAAQPCGPGPHTARIVTIKDGEAVPEHTDAPLCDTLTITNTDDEVKEMAFGLHEKHEAYDGIEEKSLKKGESLTVTLVETGNFRFHDHIQDDSQGTFTVTKPAP